jgi:hypothetical protein
MADKGSAARAWEPKTQAVACGHNHEKAFDALFRRPVLGSHCRCVPTALSLSERVNSQRGRQRVSIADGFAALSKALMFLCRE